MEIERLIEMERRNDDRVRRATEEAAGIVRAATETARQREAAVAGELQQAVSASAAAIATERERRVAAIVARARDEVARYAAITDAQVAAIAQTLVEDLVADRGSG